MLRIFIAFLCAATVASAAERTLDLTLPGAVRMALQKNYAIEVARFDPKTARERVTQAQSRFDADFEAGYSRGESATRDRFERDAAGNGRHFEFSSISQSANWSTGVSGVTVWGLGYDVGAQTRTSGGTANRFDEDIESGVSFSLRQPLLRGAGAAANLSSIRIARNNVTVSEWALKQQVMQVISDVVEVYNDLHFAKENVEVARRNKALAATLLRDNIKRVEIGVKTPLDVTTAQAEVAAREESVITAVRNVKDQENFLKQLVTRDMLALLNTRVEIAPPASPAFRADVTAGVARALDLRPDYRQAKLDLENRNITLAFEKNQQLPQLDLLASLSMNGFDDDFGTSLRRTPGRDRSDWSTGAVFSIPIGNRAANSRVSTARLEIAQGLVNLQRLEQDIIVRVDNASGAVTTARQRIEATTESSRLAKESLVAGEARLVAGSGTTFEVLELQRKVAEAETAELRARSDYNKAVARFHLQTGATLAVHGVKIE